MAASFQRFSDSISRGISSIGAKTSNTLEKAKLKTKIDSLNRDIDKVYSVIGADLYIMWEKGAVDINVFAEKLEYIKKNKEEIAKLNQSIDELGEKDDQIFKTTQAAPEEPAAVANAVVCPTCGETFNEPVKFCRKCGANLQNL